MQMQSLQLKQEELQISSWSFAIENNDMVVVDVVLRCVSQCRTAEGTLSPTLHVRQFVRFIVRSDHQKIITKRLSTVHFIVANKNVNMVR